MNRYLTHSLIINDKIVPVLLEAGADINAQDNDGKTVLMYVMNEDNDRTFHLLRAGADPNISDNEGKTALLNVDSLNTFTPYKLFDALIKAGADVNAKDKNRRTALMRAAERCSNYKSNFYVSYGDKEAYPPVPVHNGYFCRHDEEIEILKMLIKAGAKIDSKDNAGNTALLCALKSAFNLTPDIFDNLPTWKRARRVIEAFTIETFEILLSNGADINAADTSGCNALMIASMNPSKKIVRFLIKHKADVNAQDNAGLTALMHASMYLESENYDPEIIKILLKAKADPNITDCEGKRAIDYADMNEKLKINENLEYYELLASATAE